MRYENTTVKRVFAGDEGGVLWESTHASLRDQRLKLQKLLADAEEGVEAARAALTAASEGAAMTPLGGELVLVDLAGADYDHRAGAAQKESAAINTSLLALKECFRSLAQQISGSRPKFRDSKLTRMLEDALSPTVKSERRNKTSVSVMLVNISPAAELQKGTINALRYGQLYAGGRSGGASKAVLGKGASGGTRAGGPKPWQRAPCDPAILAALRAIYTEHVPEKTVEEVEAILKRFAGKEAVLLGKVRAKYGVETQAAVQ